MAYCEKAPATNRASDPATLDFAFRCARDIEQQRYWRRANKSKPAADVKTHSSAADDEPTMRAIWDVGSSPPAESVKLLPATDADTLI